MTQHICPDCKNVFLQPFRCTTCGAQKLYDTTLRQAEQRAERAEAELAAARALLEQCPPHIRGNVGAWEHIRPKLGPDGQRSTDNAIAEGRALLVAIDTALGGT